MAYSLTELNQAVRSDPKGFAEACDAAFAKKVEDAARRANVKNAYQVVDPELVEGRRVLLIDDVVTTGSTLSECARTLLAAGALNVVGATLARAR